MAGDGWSKVTGPQRLGWRIESILIDVMSQGPGGNRMNAIESPNTLIQLDPDYFGYRSITRTCTCTPPPPPFLNSAPLVTAQNQGQSGGGKEGRSSEYNKWIPRRGLLDVG